MTTNSSKFLDAHVLGMLNRDGRLLFATRIIRLFAYGLVSVVLFLFLTELGYGNFKAGLLLTLTLIGDTLISFPVTGIADRIGRRRMLALGAVLMIMAGVVFSWSSSFILLLLAATIGVISPSGNEVGPFLAIEQAALSQLVLGSNRTATFAWYNLAGSLATALGALTAGIVTRVLQAENFSILQSYRMVLMGYAMLGAILLIIFAILSPAVEIGPVTGTSRKPRLFGLHRSRKVVMGLSALFSLDAFAGGFIVQSLMAAWFHVRFGASISTIGAIFFGANLLAGISALTAARIAKRFGLINTMVFTHIPSNLLLILVPLMPSLPWAIVVLLVRFSISQMDVPTRQSFTMAVVDPDERSAAAGVTGIARTLGASFSPVLAGRLLAFPAFFSAPFFLAGTLKIVYDIILWQKFRRLTIKEDQLPTHAASKETRVAGL